MIRMHVSRKPWGLCYQTSTVRRIIYLVIFVFMLWGCVVTILDKEATGTLWIPIVWMILSLIGLLYDEKWEFRPEEKIVVERFGFGPLGKKKTYKFDEIRKLTITHFVKGDIKADAKADPKKKKKAMVVFALEMQDDTTHTIEIIPERTSWGRTEHAAQAISSATGLALYVDRPIDRDLNVTMREF